MKTHPRIAALALLSALCGAPLAPAQTPSADLAPAPLAPPAKPDATPAAPVAPSAELLRRADKIVAALGLSDPELTTRVRDLVAGQYAALSAIHDERDAAQKAAEAGSVGPAAAQAARDRAASRQADLHYAFLARLSAELTPVQIEQIKDGMTYDVVPKTFRVYQEMLPNLTPAQRTQILAWLTEAREHAMDAGSSKEKHAWFGKYKGRINNYLSKAGYDMKQAERDMFARKNAAAKAAR
jgi:hypothetical protein